MQSTVNTTTPFIFSRGGVYQWGVNDEELIFLDWDEIEEGVNTARFSNFRDDSLIEYAREKRYQIVEAFGEEPFQESIRDILRDLDEAIATMVKVA